MELINLNIITFLIFIGIIGIIFYAALKSYNNQLNINKHFKLLATNKYFYIKYLFLILSFIILLSGIFGIKIGDKKINNQNKGIDIMFVLDVSKSMNVADINDSNYKYTRLDVVKDSIGKFVSTHKEDRFGLVIFAGDAVSTIPLTTDHDLFLTFLANVDYRNLTKQGSDFEKALSLGVDRFSTSNDRSKAIIFISDGGDSEDNINKQSIEKIKEKVKGVHYFVAGVGTNAGGEIIIGRDPFGRLSYQKYNGEYVISKINKNNLKDINSVLGGDYTEISNANDLSKFNNKIDELDKKIINTDTNGEKADGGRLISIISFILFIIFLTIYLYEKNRSKKS